MATNIFKPFEKTGINMEAYKVMRQTCMSLPTYPIHCAKCG